MTVKRISLLLLLLLQAHFLGALHSRALSTALTGRRARSRSPLCLSAQKEGQVAPSQSPPEIEEQFKEWEKEERELLIEELRDQARSDPDYEGSDDELPAYMLRMIEKFEDQQLTVVQDEEQAEKLPSIAVIGRPNTGKSTIVNRLTETYKDGAIVHDEPGITRDRTYRTATHNGYNFQVIDTGGIVFDDTEDVFASKITEQALQGLREACCALLICDGQAGVTPLDRSLADWLRKNNKIPVYLCVNKCESETRGFLMSNEFWELGLDTPYPVSGIHGTGLGDLLDMVTTKHMKKVLRVARENVTNIAFIGRPNVGKSSLFNKLLGQDRSIVSNIAGTTRDSIDAVLRRNGITYRIIDTAGIRRKGKIERGAEYFMVNRAFKAVKRAEVVVLLLDAVDGIVEQDRILAERIAEEGRACVIALNKWDAVDSKDDKTYIKAVENVRSSLPILRWAEVILISAKTGQRTEKLFETVNKAAKQFTRRVSTAILNEIVHDATLWMAPPTVGSRSGRIYYSIQTSTAPPTVVIFCNDPALFTDNYRRFLERKIRDSLDFGGTPLKIIYRGKALRDVGRTARGGEDEQSRNRVNDKFGKPVGLSPLGRVTDNAALIVDPGPGRRNADKKSGETVTRQFKK